MSASSLAPHTAPHMLHAFSHTPSHFPPTTHTSPSEAHRRAFDQFVLLTDGLVKLCHWAPAGGRQVKSISARAEFSPLLALMPACGVRRGGRGGGGGGGRVHKGGRVGG